MILDNHNCLKTVMVKIRPNLLILSFYNFIKITILLNCFIFLICQDVNVNVSLMYIYRYDIKSAMYLLTQTLVTSIIDQ